MRLIFYIEIVLIGYIKNDYWYIGTLDAKNDINCLKQATLVEFCPQ